MKPPVQYAMMPPRADAPKVGKMKPVEPPKVAKMRGFDAALDYYLGPTGIPDRLRALNSMLNPVETLGGSMRASQRMLAPDTAPMDRVQAAGDMLSGVAGFAAPMAAASKVGAPAASAVAEAFTGLSTGAQKAGATVVDRLNQPGPMPTLYSNPIPGFAGADRGGIRMGRNPLDTADAGGKSSVGELPMLNVDFMREIVQKVRGISGANPRKAVKSAIADGLIPESDRMEAYAFADRVKAVTVQRNAAKADSVDPLLSAARTRPLRAERMRETNEAFSSPIADSWRKDFAARVKSAPAGPAREAEARKATIEAVVAEARRLGLEVRHTSSHNGRASSRYIVTPDGREIRVSDHYLPLTERRQQAGSRWDAELIVDDWRSTSLSDYIAQILTPQE
jgi:hypothetical protein